MEDVRKILVPAAIGVAAAVTTLYGVGVFTVLAATTGGGSAGAQAPRPPPPRGSAAAEAAGRKRAGTGLPGDAPVRSTTSSGVGEPGGGAAVYESSKAVDEYLLFHYGKARAPALRRAPLRSACARQVAALRQPRSRRGGCAAPRRRALTRAAAARSPSC